jgi:hypothetical protein
VRLTTGDCIKGDTNIVFGLNPQYSQKIWILNQSGGEAV